MDSSSAKKEQKKSLQEGLLAIAGEEVVPETRAKKKNKLERKKNLKRLHVEDMDSSSAKKEQKKSLQEGLLAIAGEEVVPEIRAKKKNKLERKKNLKRLHVEEASSNENDEKRIAQSFEKMYKKMSMAGRMTSYRAKANKPKISGNMQYFVDAHAYKPPFNVLFDNPFYELYMLPNKDIVVNNIMELLGDKFFFCHTKCVLKKIFQKHLFDFLLKLPNKEYRCRDDVGMVAKDLECLRDVVLDIGLDDSLVLATGDSKFHSLMRRLSPIPIIYLDNLEAYFEGQTSSRRNIVSKEKQNEGTSSGDFAKENDEVRIDQEMRKVEKVISKQEKADKPKQESLERKKTPAQRLIEEMERIHSSVSGEGACEDKMADRSILQNNSSAKEKSGQKGRWNTGVGVSFEGDPAKTKESNTGASEKKISKQAKGKKRKMLDQELVDFYHEHYS